MSDGALFGGVHKAVNAWADEGGTLAPHEAMPIEGQNKGEPRFNGVAGDIGWTKNVLVTTGMTRGGGTMAH